MSLFDLKGRVAIVTDFTFDQKIKDHRSELPILHYVIASIPEYLRFPLNVLAPLKLKKQKPHPAIAKVAQAMAKMRAEYAAVADSLPSQQQFLQMAKAWAPVDVRVPMPGAA